MRYLKYFQDAHEEDRPAAFKVKQLKCILKFLTQTQTYTSGNSNEYFSNFSIKPYSNQFKLPDIHAARLRLFRPC